MQSNSKNKILDTILNVFFAVLFVLGAAGIILYVLGFRYYAVETGSMQSIYPVGTMLIVRPIEAEKLNEGDVISYVVSQNVVVTHRIQEINHENEYVITKGDDVNQSDKAPVYFENIIGKVILGIPVIGIVVMWSHTMVGRIIIIGIIVFLIALYVVQLIGEARNDRKEKGTDEE